jgi:DNA-directed RNA polymerase specialized sigma24 family protein
LSETVLAAGIWSYRTTGAMSLSGQEGTVVAPSVDHLTPEEIANAFDSLSPQDKLKLAAVERVYLGGTGLAPKELLHEAMCSAIMGVRRCPRDLVFMAFIIQSMRSIANHEREKRARETADGSVDEGGAAPAIFTSPASTPEEMLLEREAVDATDAIQKCFDGDEQAQMVILGWSAGYRGKELRDFVGADQPALDYAIKRIRRAMTKRFPNGWTS